MKYLFFLLFTAVSMACFSQKNISRPVIPKRTKDRIVSLGKVGVYSGDIKFPFSKFKVLDSRFDTSKISFLPNVGNDRYAAMKTAEPLSFAIEEFLNGNYQSAMDNSKMKLLIVLKKFWISDIKAFTKATVTSGSKVYLSWETYIGRDDEYLPFKRLDTTINFDFAADVVVKKRKANKDSSDLMDVIEELLEGYNYGAAVKVFNDRSKKSLEEIMVYNSKRFLYPVLISDSVKSGVYRTFSEFLNNNPGVTNFTEQKMKTRFGDPNSFATCYIVDSSGNPIHDYWAYCINGQIKKGKFDNAILIRSGNTFDLFLPAQTKDAGNQIYFPGNIRYSSPNNVRTWFAGWLPFQIDMETGKAY